MKEEVKFNVTVSVDDLQAGFQHRVRQNLNDMLTNSSDIYRYTHNNELKLKIKKLYDAALDEAIKSVIAETDLKELARTVLEQVMKTKLSKTLREK